VSVCCPWCPSQVVVVVNLNSCAENSGGKVVDVLSRIGWCSGSVMVRRAYFLQVCCSRMAGGGSDASTSIGMTGEVRNAPRIRLEAAFCSF
jgi:hypothetical protein